MNIVHIAPFAPFRCGLYEMARDMLRADYINGHNAYFIDSLEGQNGTTDNRGDFELVTSQIDILNQCDVILMHTGYHDSILVQNDKPLVWVLHGRPEACYNPEMFGKGHSYSLTYNVSRWQRTKKLIHFWQEFNGTWKSILPTEKIELINNIPVNDSIYKPDGEKYKIQNPGDINILIADSEREDKTLHNVIVSCIQLVKNTPDKNIKIHFFGLDFPLKMPLNALLVELNNLGGLGDRLGRFSEMEKVYRAMDFLISPHRIATRVIVESSKCNLQVIAPFQNNYADKFFDTEDTTYNYLTLQNYINTFKPKCLNHKGLNIKKYNKQMNKIYMDIINK